MNSVSNNSSLSNDNTYDNSFIPKLRRLKIQEGVLSSNVDKWISQNLEDNHGLAKQDKNLELKKYFCKMKDSCKDIKILFEEITNRTNDHISFEKTEFSDIDELKKYILELETKIKVAKQFVDNELQALRKEEIILYEMEHGRLNEEKMVRNIKTTYPKGLKAIVSSPVRIMIHSPFKCLEVQQFQYFMKNSLTRYGGWNEYTHNIFVQIWNKYYGPNQIYGFESIKDQKNFKEEILYNIAGTNGGDVDSHVKWYTEYLRLKVNQEMALSKWKENKRKIKATRKTQENKMAQSTTGERTIPVNTKLCKKSVCGKYNDRNELIGRSKIVDDIFTEINEDHINYNQFKRKDFSTCSGVAFIEEKCNDITKIRKTNKKFDLTKLTRPTKQWINRRDSVKDTYEFNGIVENINKLRIPVWRSSLHQ